MIYRVVLKEGKFPLMTDRVIMEKVPQNMLSSASLVDELKDLELTLQDVDFVLNIEDEKNALDAKRDKELSGFVISDIAMNENIIKTMAVQFNIAEDDETIEWIDINNQTVTFSKVEFGGLIKQGSQKVKEIYFKYRALKNKLEEA